MFGIIVGGIFRIMDMINMQHEFFFSPEAFYFLLLPPIIFAAGFNLQKRYLCSIPEHEFLLNYFLRDFFMNFGSILMFAVVGTVISTIVFGLFLYGMAKLGALHSIDKHHALESMIFGALISAVDPVATLSIMGSPEMSVHPLVYSLVFGESVLNDAVSIVLFR